MEMPSGSIYAVHKIREIDTYKAAFCIFTLQTNRVKKAKRITLAEVVRSLPHRVMDSKIY